MDKPTLYTPEQIETVLREEARCAIASIRVCFDNVAKGLCVPSLENGCIHKDINSISLLSEIAGAFELERLSTFLFWQFGKYMDKLEQLREQMKKDEDE